MYRKVFFVLAAVLLCSFTQAVAQEAKSKELSKEEIVSIATLAVKQSGKQLDEVVVIYDQDNKLWVEKIGSYKELNDSPNFGIFKHGFMKNYRAVFFDFKAPVTDLWVFVDKDSGEVLGVFPD